MRIQTISHVLLAATLVTSIPACELDVPDLNNPGLGDLTDNPTPAGINAASTGLLIGTRRNRAAANGYVAQLGILGREAYNFDQADPRFIGELLQGNLNSGSPFGGNFWAGPYANIRLANTILTAIDKVSDGELPPADKANLRGFVKTIEALDLLEVITTRDDIGAVIDTDRELDAGLGAIADKAAVLDEIAKLLDDAAADLGMAGMDDEFTFALSSGFAGFDTPQTFRTFNRALRARVAVYEKDYGAALTALGMSFLDDTVTTQAELDAGAYYSYSTAPGDAVNNLINPNIFAHPSLLADVMKNGMVNDLRYTRKVTTTMEAGSAQGLTSNLVFTIYDGPDAPVPMIRNEELLLLRAEARFFSNMQAMAMADLNLVRTVSGGLTAIGGTPAEPAFVDALLYERRYSLLFEGGHRWIDARRLNKLSALPKDMPTHQVNQRYPIPLAECNGRPGEAKCELDSVP